jgi:hypothetical protein
MKLRYFFRILFAVALSVLIGACATTPSGPAALAGQWTNPLGTVWTINPDGTFHARVAKPKAEIWGNYTLAGDTMTVQETRHSGAVPKNCRGPGVYKFTRPDANTLTFVMVNDVCKPRIQNVTQPWHRM